MNCIPASEWEREFIDEWEQFKRLIESNEGCESAASTNESFRQLLMGSWYIPKSTTKGHQVMSRKPMYSRIRNNI